MTQQKKDMLETKEAENTEAIEDSNQSQLESQNILEIIILPEESTSTDDQNINNEASNKYNCEQILQNITNLTPVKDDVQIQTLNQDQV